MICSRHGRTRNCWQEGLTRNLAAFARFLEAASFSQGSVLNMAAVARECGISAKAAENWFTVLEDLLIAARLPALTRRAKRRVVLHPKFYFFDAGVFQTVRPRGPLDAPEGIHGPALETLFLQHLRAINDYFGLGYTLHYWRTRPATRWTSSCMDPTACVPSRSSSRRVSDPTI